MRIVSHRQHLPQTLAAAIATACAVATWPAYADIVGAPIDLSAHVREADIPGATIFDDTHSTLGAGTTPVQQADYLYFADKGQNLSGHSTNIVPAFASSLAKSDGNGGVGVTAWIGGDANNHPPGVRQLVSEATWKQNFTYNGTVPISISLHLNIPSLEVGLIGVAPDRNSVSAEETAEAKATLETTIIHADASTTPGRSFEFGLRAFERQFPLGPGVFENVADVAFIGATNVSLFDSFKDNGNQSNPRFSVNAVTTDVKLGDLKPGDTVSYVYKLTAQGTTAGGEHGYMAFLGDPFGLEATSGNLVLSTAVVPEPSTWVLCVLGLAGVAVALRRRSVTPG
jgi:hypothetical protein